MKFSLTPFEDLFLIEPKSIGDERGWFMRTFSEDLFLNNIPSFNSKWVQINHSFSKEKGTWRGFHFQNSPFQETKLVRCICGSIIDVVIDLRENSKTFLNTFHIELSEKNKCMIYIPKGFAHGFLTLEESTQLIYLHDQFYNPDYESGIRFDDPMINIETSINPIIISNRDKSHKLLNKQFKGI